MIKKDLPMYPMYTRLNEYNIQKAINATTGP